VLAFLKVSTQTAIFPKKTAFVNIVGKIKLAIVFCKIKKSTQHKVKPENSSYIKELCNQN